MSKEKTVSPKTPPLEGPGEHGPKKPPTNADSFARLRKLLNLSKDVTVVTLMREAADEIEELRRVTGE